jgi:formylmethanofuran dehydrogenase subunit E
MIDELIMARNMEKAGNYEKAAVILEKYRFWEEAGRMRRLDDQKVIKHITVDMNALINQVGTKGLAIPYKCSSCGASITIDKDSKQDGLKFCSYCGTAYNVDDMTKIIQHALE